MKKVLAVIIGVMLLAGCGGSGGKKKTTPEVEKPLTFVKTYETGEFYSVENTDDGGYIASGRYKGRALLVKYSKNGNIEWEKKFDDNTYTAIESIKQSDEGGYFASGETDGFQGTATIGEADIITIKLTSMGAVEWAKMVGGSNTESFNDSEITPDGGLIVCGKSSSKEIIGEIDSSYVSLLYYKLDATGNLIWMKVMEKTKGEAIKKSGNEDKYIITGISSNSKISEMSATTGDGILCMEIDGNGNIEKGKMLAVDKEYSWAYGGDVSENEIILSGNSGYDEESDNYLLKLDNNMNVIWDKISGGSKNDRLCKVIDINGQIIVVGETYSSDFDGMVKVGKKNIYIAKYNGDGSLVWQKIIGSNSEDFVEGIKKTADGGFVMVGQTKGTIFMGKPLNQENAWDLNSFIVKFDKDGNVY